MEDERRSIDVSGVFDIETEDWDRFVCGGLLWREGDGNGAPILYRDFLWDKEEALVDSILSVKGTTWAHFGGRFDVLWLLSHIVRRQLKAQIGLQGSRIARVRIGETTIRDSYSLIPMKLSEVAKIGGTEKAETGLQCVCDRECGGFCSIRRGMSRDLLSRLRSYLEQDCRGLFQGLQGLVGFAAEKDLDLAGTVGHAAWSTAKRWLDLDDIDWGEPPHSFQRYRDVAEGYYGGRTQVFRPMAESGFRYDINSAYPAALASTALPIGKEKVLHGKAASRAWEMGKEGIYTADCDVPREMHLPPLPVRMRDRISFPVAKVRGTWTRPELARAIGLGVKLCRIQKAIVWPVAEKILAPFFAKVWGFRQALGKSHPVAKWLKWFLNSCTGKFAQRPRHEVVIVNPEPDKVGFCRADFPCHGVLCGVKCCVHQCTGHCGRWRTLDSDQAIWSKIAWRIAPNAYVHWAAYLTAVTRVTLLDQLLDDGEDGHSAVYCDTDSVYATKPRTKNIGNELGQFACEGRFQPWRDEVTGAEQPGFFAVAPKSYRYHDGEKVVAKAKGIPKAETHWHEIVNGRSVAIDRGVLSFKKACASGELFVKMDVARRSHADGVWFGDRLLGDKPWTSPCTVEYLKEQRS